MKPCVTRFTIIRHGETIWNSQGLLQGHLDSPLSELGLKQAQAVASAFCGRQFDKIFCSDLGRAFQTASILGKSQNAGIHKESRLRERNLGIAQGLTMKQFAEKYPEQYEQFSKGDPDFIIGGGESILQRFERSISFFEESAGFYKGKDILIVTHGGVLDGVFRRTVGLTLKQERHFSLYNASINIISIQDCNWTLENWGMTGHLESLGTLDDWYKGAI